MRVTHVNAMTETEPNGASSVTLSRTDVDALGRAVPVIRLATTRKDRESIARMKASCIAVAEAIAQAGAELLLIEEPAPNRYLFHEAGTCVMGVGAEAPCTPWGRLRAVDNVWIADASVFPSAGDRHPTLTVLAHALRVARDMQRHLSRWRSPLARFTANRHSLEHGAIDEPARDADHKTAFLQHVKRTVRSIATTQVSRHPSGKPATTDQETAMNRTMNSDKKRADVASSKLSLNKETLRQLKVRTGLKGGRAPANDTTYTLHCPHGTLNCSQNC
jgi:hypothetical protein